VDVFTAAVLGSFQKVALLEERVAPLIVAAFASVIQKFKF
jgi:hypothetical protein